MSIMDFPSVGTPPKSKARAVYELKKLLLAPLQEKLEGSFKRDIRCVLESYITAGGDPFMIESWLEDVFLDFLGRQDSTIVASDPIGRAKLFSYLPCPLEFESYDVQIRVMELEPSEYGPRLFVHFECTSYEAIWTMKLDAEVSEVVLDFAERAYHIAAEHYLSNIVSVE